MPDPIRILDHDPRWPELFRALAKRVRTASGGMVVAVEYVGSTAVPGLAAKPVVDLDVVVLPGTSRWPSSASRRSATRTRAIRVSGGREAFRWPPGEARQHSTSARPDSPALRDLARCRVAAPARCRRGRAGRGDARCRGRAAILATVPRDRLAEAVERVTRSPSPPAPLKGLELGAAPAGRALLDAVEHPRVVQGGGGRPGPAPTAFAPEAWAAQPRTADGRVELPGYRLAGRWATARDPPPRRVPVALAAPRGPARRPALGCGVGGGMAGGAPHGGRVAIGRRGTRPPVGAPRPRPGAGRPSASPTIRRRRASLTRGRAAPHRRGGARGGAGRCRRRLARAPGGAHPGASGTRRTTMLRQGGRLFAFGLVIASGTAAPARGGADGNACSSLPAISADGRFVAFVSVASNLVPATPTGSTDVFVRDRQTGTTERVSVGPGGSPGQRRAADLGPSISADGRFVAFVSRRHQPGAAATPTLRRTCSSATGGRGTTERVSVGRGRRPGQRRQLLPGDLGGRPLRRLRVGRHQPGAGRHQRRARRLRPRPADGHDRAGERRRGRRPGQRRTASSRRSRRTAASWPSTRDASNLVPGDTNGVADVFVRDRRTGTTERVSVGPGGAQGNELSFDPAISADGRFVAFGSGATNLVPGDTNGAHRRLRPRPPDRARPSG